VTAFEALFAFYGLLLGLAIAAVASGFGEQWRRRRVRPIGCLVPLLGLYVLLAASQQWLSFWSARDSLTLTPFSLFMSLAMALPYIFVAQVVFPVTDEDAGSGDDHYLADHRIFLGVLMLPLMFSLTYNLIAGGVGSWGDLLEVLVVWVWPLLVLAALIPIRRRAWHFAGLILLIADRLIVILG
jgi:hypothetical protein